MRREIDRTTYRIRDLAEQPQAKYLLRFDSPSIQGVPGLSTTVWVDEVVDNEEAYGRSGLLKDGTVVVTFGYDHTWFLIARENLDILTVGDIYEQERMNIAEREVTKRSMLQAYKEAQDEQPKAQGWQPKPPEDGIDWNEELRNL